MFLLVLQLFNQIFTYAAQYFDFQIYKIAKTVIKVKPGVTNPVSRIGFTTHASSNYLLSETGRYTPSDANQILSGRFNLTPQTCRQ